ncbi:MAG: hypothetical protein AB2697_22645 [Candidatus Thiodiazotropha endolucinida]
MIKLASIPKASEQSLISTQSYYRLADDGLMPPPIRVTQNRSAIIQYELDAVIAARANGATDDEIRTLIKQLVSNRKQLAEAS